MAVFKWMSLQSCTHGVRTQGLSFHHLVMTVKDREVLGRGPETELFPMSRA